MRRPMNWVEKLLQDHADEQYGYDCHFRGCKEVEKSKWWYAWERFADAMQTLTLRVEEESEYFAEPLDTRARIRDYGPNADRGSAIEWEEPRQ
jgi:hypothetical protein